MALTRSQLLAGNQAQGVVLEGQVQAVKEGSGIKINPDGTIRVDAASVEGLIKLNNPVAFNSYVWPTTSGTTGDVLFNDGAGNLRWGNAAGTSVVTVGETAPVSAQIGQLWFDSNEKILKVYENVDDIATRNWTPVSRGLDADLSLVSATPEFEGGEGTVEAPFSLSTLTLLGGSFATFPQIIEISGFAPYQYVPITDLNSESNGNRFSFSSNFTDSEGVLRFKVQFTDFPVTGPGRGFVANIEVGFNSVYISASVNISAPLSVFNAGTISGSPIVGQVLGYSGPTAQGGFPPYEYSWVWRRASDSAILQEDGSSYVLPGSISGDKVTVTFTATDSNGNTVTGATDSFPVGAVTIEKGPFQSTNLAFPDAANKTAVTEWLDTDTVLTASGCVEISKNGTVWTNSLNITNRESVHIRWIPGISCTGAAHETIIRGCVSSDSASQCGELRLVRVPTPFSFLPEAGVQRNAIVTSNTVSLTGITASAFITYDSISTLTEIDASLDNGSTWVRLSPFGSAIGFEIQPGQSFKVRGKTGSQAANTYKAIIKVGSGLSAATGSFDVTTSAETPFDTNIIFPENLEQGHSTPGALTPNWQDQVLPLTATGCLEIQVESSDGTVLQAYGSPDPYTIQLGNNLRTRWKKSSSCGEAVHGTTITGSVTNKPGGSKVTEASIQIDRVIGAFSFQDVTGQATSSQVTSNQITVSGNNAEIFIWVDPSSTLTGVQASISNLNGGAWAEIPTAPGSLVLKPSAPGSPAPTLRIRGTTGSATSTDYKAIINIGQGASSLNTDEWVVRTTAAVSTVVAPSILTPINGSTNLNPRSSNPSGITFTASTYQATNGASTHLSSEWELREGSTVGTAFTQTITSGTLTSWFVPEVDGTTVRIKEGTKYFVRVRYRSSDNPAVVSNWSAFSEFSTTSAFQLLWREVSTVRPANGFKPFWSIRNNPLSSYIPHAIDKSKTLWIGLPVGWDIVDFTAGGTAALIYDAKLANKSIIETPVGARPLTYPPVGPQRQPGFFAVAPTSTDRQFLCIYKEAGVLTGLKAALITANDQNLTLTFSFLGAGGLHDPPSNLTTGSYGTYWGVGMYGLAYAPKSELPEASEAGRHVIVGGEGYIQSSDTSGTSWVTRLRSGRESRFTDVIWDGEKFIAIGWGAIATSPNGVTWTEFDAPFNNVSPQYYKIHFTGTGSGRRYIVVPRTVPAPPPAGQPRPEYYYSSNLTSWTVGTVNIPTSIPGGGPDPLAGQPLFIQLAAAGPNGFLINGSRFRNANDVYLFTSPTGEPGTWSLSTSPFNRDSYFEGFTDSGLMCILDYIQDPSGKGKFITAHGGVDGNYYVNRSF